MNFKIKNHFLLAGILAFSFIACKKNMDSEFKDKLSENKPSSFSSMSSINSGPGACYDILQPDSQNDTNHVPTILGTRLVNNPYAVTVMQQASMNLYGQAAGIFVNKKYVRFKPSNYQQLQQLTETDLELYDYPLDYPVVQEGDYFNQGLPQNEIPWYYTVVEPSFTPPSGITYELLADLYVPDTDIYLENEAFRITGNPIDPDCSGSSAALEEEIVSSQSETPCEQQVCQEEFTRWDQNSCACVPDLECPPGFHYDFTISQCVQDANNPPQPPPASQPAGQIRVVDNRLGSVAVRQTRVVIKRFFKIDRVYTNDNGDFASNKRYNNKVTITIKFKNNGLTIKGLRGLRFYQMYIPMSYGVGTFRGNLNTVNYEFEEPTDINSRGYRNWWAAQLMNSYTEYNETASSPGFLTGTVPNNMQILLTNWGAAAGAGSTPMNNHRINNGIKPREWIEFFIADPLRNYAVEVVNFFGQFAYLQNVDMTLGYNIASHWRSDRIKALIYHELSHAAHFNKVGATWWNAFVYSEETTIVKYAGSFDPYGDGTDGISSEYISLGESWAEHMARVMCDQRYASSSSSVEKQGNSYSNTATPIRSSHLNALEGFDPNVPTIADPFRWIPEGIYLDLLDTNNENSPIVDVVSGYTHQQFFEALDSDVKSMPQFRNRLLQEGTSAQQQPAQQQQVIALFNSYNY